ncbi:hypothetical protein HZA44_00865 [Candidatus Peregrinibacteria bacterium]|nr:hypothetical protein [Candidatus Peregrinibacteria bacterium]
MGKIALGSRRGLGKRGSSLVELVIVTVLFAILVPASLEVFVSGRKISGQSYIQHQAAVTLGEVDDILRYMRGMDFGLLPNGDFFLIRNPGTGSWLVKSDLPDKDTFERHIIVSSALRHTGTGDLYMPGDTGTSYEDPDTKKIDINILWAPDYLPLDLISHTIYLTDWTKSITYASG